MKVIQHPQFLREAFPALRNSGQLFNTLAGGFVNGEITTKKHKNVKYVVTKRDLSWDKEHFGDSDPPCIHETPPRGDLGVTNKF